MGGCFLLGHLGFCYYELFICGFSADTRPCSCIFFCLVNFVYLIFSCSDLPAFLLFQLGIVSIEKNRRGAANVAPNRHLCFCKS